MRYRFRGLVRDTGKPVEGHVEADTEEFAFHLLANNGIVTESLRADPRPEDIRPPVSAQGSPLLPPLAQAMLGGTRPATPPAPPAQGYVPQTRGYAPQAYGRPAGYGSPIPAPLGSGGPIAPYAPAPPDPTPIPGTPEVVNAIDTALDTSSSQIEFDALTERYRGKKVWVIDRDKIKRNVARVVDHTLTQGLKGAESAADIRESVSEAIEKLFKDNRNLTSPAGSGGGQGTANLDRQIERLANVIKNFENSLASMQMAIRNIGSGGGGFVPRRHMGQAAQPLREEQNAVLMEIFKTNMDLLRGMEDEMQKVNAAATGETAISA